MKWGWIIISSLGLEIKEPVTTKDFLCLVDCNVIFWRTIECVFIFGGDEVKCVI